MFGCRIDPRRHGRRRKPEIGQAHDLALAHWDAAGDLRQIFAGTDADQKLFDLAEVAGGRQPLRIGGELTQRLEVGREPSQAVGGALLAIERPRIGAAVAHDPFRDRATGIGEQGFDGIDRLAQRSDQFAVSG